jgi:hypothetical protein
VNVVAIKAKQEKAKAFRLVVVLRKLAEAVDHQDELSVIETHWAMLHAAVEYGPAHWDRLWLLAGFDGPADVVVVERVMVSLRELVEGKAS